MLLTSASTVIKTLCKGEISNHDSETGTGSEEAVLRADIETGVINCLKRVCEHYEHCTLLNHHYIKGICFILGKKQFQKKGKVNISS